MGNAYDKPFRSLDEQIDILQDRGMSIDDRDDARAALDRIGYYRLSGYSYVQRIAVDAPAAARFRLDSFHLGSTFAQVVALYEFDRELRALLLRGIDAVEVALRAKVGHLLGRHDGFSHRTIEFLDDRFVEVDDQSVRGPHSPPGSSPHGRWLGSLDRETARSREEFVQHFRDRYDGVLPVWVATEIMTFGTLALLVGGMRQIDRDRLALELGLAGSAGAGDGSLLNAFLENLRVVRNKCAHHARIWNARMVAILGVPTGPAELLHLKPIGLRERIYATIAVLAYVHTVIGADPEWRSNVAELVLSLQSRTGRAPAELGFPEDWLTLEIWDPDFVPTVDVSTQLARGAALSAFRTLTPEQLRDHDLVQEVGDTAGALLRRLRQRGLLIGLKVGEAFVYPAFQFSAPGGRLDPDVARVNRSLIEHILGSSAVREASSIEMADAAWAAGSLWLGLTPPGSPLDTDVDVAAIALVLAEHGIELVDPIDELLDAAIRPGFRAASPRPVAEVSDGGVAPPVTPVR